MKRTVLCAALCAGLGTSALAQSSPATPPAVAFDQVDVIALGPYGSSPNDFAGDVAALTAAAADARPMTITMPIKTLKRFAYLHGQSRVETVGTHTVVITKPGEVDMLDTAKKSYRKITGDALKKVPVGSGGLALPLMPTTGALATPGSMDVKFTLDGSTLDPLAGSGAPTTGYRIALTLATANATGSCGTLARFANLQGTIETYVVDRAEPIAAAMPGTGFPFLPQDLTKLPGFNPKGCAIDSMSVQMNHLAKAVGLAGFYLYRRIEIVFDAQSGIALSPTLVSERGNIRDLSDADAALFTIPGDYTPLP